MANTYIRLNRPTYVEFRTEDSTDEFRKLVEEWDGFFSCKLITKEVHQISFYNVSNHDSELIGNFETQLQEIGYERLS